MNSSAKRTPSEGDRDEFALFGEQQYFKALREVESVLDDLGVERGATKPVTEPVDLGDLVRKHTKYSLPVRTKTATLHL